MLYSYLCVKSICLKVLVFDRNAWNRISVCKYIIIDKYDNINWKDKMEHQKENYDYNQTLKNEFEMPIN